MVLRGMDPGEKGVFKARWESKKWTPPLLVKAGGGTKVKKKLL